MNIFVSGTDTSVGKTVVSTVLCLKLGCRYWKPIQSGMIEETDSNWVKKQIGHRSIELESYQLQRPLSPHLAARLENVDINFKKIIKKANKLSNTIVEGAGGLLVPINEKLLMIDLIRNLGMPLILVSRSGLGTINHTLLSIEAIKSRTIKLLSVIMVGEKNYENRMAIEFYGKVRVLGEIPFCLRLIANPLRNSVT